GSERGDVVKRRAERLGDGRRGLVGHEPGTRLRAHERTLRGEHRVQPRAVGDSLRQLVGDEDRGEGPHAEKKIVSRSPWRWMSKRKPPSSRSATRRARSASWSDDSTRSAAFASASSGK